MGWLLKVSLLSVVVVVDLRMAFLLVFGFVVTNNCLCAVMCCAESYIDHILTFVSLQTSSPPTLPTAASKNVMNLTSFLFSMTMFFVCWAWLDAEFGEDNFRKLTGEGIFFVWLFLQAFLLWYPTIGVLILCMLNNIIKGFHNGESSAVPVIMASMFVGLISVILFNYMGSVILDTIDVCFVCFAVDKDNNVDLSQSVFAQQVCKNMSDLKEGMIVGGVEGAQGQMTAQTTVAVGQPVAQQVSAPGQPMMGVPGTVVQGPDGQMMMMVAAPAPQQAL